MKKIAIIQARINSKRLPGKVLFKINGKTLVELLYLRLKKSKNIDKIVFAIPNNKENLLLKNFFKKKSIPYFLGDEKNVLDRYYKTAVKFNADIVVRITADCPLIDFKIVDKVITKHIKTKSSFTTNTAPATFPDGLDVQVSSFQLLKYIWKNAKFLYDKEHVFTFIYDNPKFKLNNIKSKIDYSLQRWTIDEKKDFILIKYIFDFFYPNIYFKYEDIIKLMNKNPKKFSINKEYVRNAGSKISDTEKIWHRAKKAIAGGNSLLSKNPEIFINKGWPTYFLKAKDCNVWDLNNKKYLDAIMTPGTNLLGYSNNEINKKVITSINNSNMSTFNAIEEVELAEKLISIHSWSGMAKFAKTGGEANTIAIRIARAASGKDKIAFCGYHGWHDWYLSANIKNKNSLNSHLLSDLDTKGVPNNLKNSIFSFKYNDFDGLKKLINKEKEIGIVMMEVVRNIQPESNFLKKIRNLCTQKKIILIFDECTSGFRTSLGGIHKNYKVNPDIAVFGKALGNGYPITAVIGKSKIMKYASKSFISSTYWTDRIGYVAALQTIKTMEKIKSWNIIKKNGHNIKQKWVKLAKKNNLEIIVSDSEFIPSFNFAKDKKNIYKNFITKEMLKYNILASNYIFVSIYHTNKKLDKYFKILDIVFRKINLFENNQYDIKPNQLILKRAFFKRLN